MLRSKELNTLELTYIIYRDLLCPTTGGNLLIARQMLKVALEIESSLASRSSLEIKVKDWPNS